MDLGAWGGDSFGQSRVPACATNLIAVAAGDWHSLALRRDGVAVAWGDNSQGQCTVPADLTGVVAVAGGGSYSIALKTDGTVAAWGDNWVGQCDIPCTLVNVVALAAGSSHTLLLLGNRTLSPQPFHPVHQGSQFSVLLETFAGRNYALEYKDSLAATNWTSLPAIFGRGGLEFLVDPGATVTHRFYRVRSE